MKKLFVLGAAVCLLAAGAAMAQEEEEAIFYPKTTVLDIQEPMQVFGELIKPSSSYMHVKRGVDFDVLIPVRDNFLPEMAKTADVL